METWVTMASLMLQCAFTLHVFMKDALHKGDDEDGDGNADDDEDEKEGIIDEDV